MLRDVAILGALTPELTYDKFIPPNTSVDGGLPSDITRLSQGRGDIAFDLLRLSQGSEQILINRLIQIQMVGVA